MIPWIEEYYGQVTIQTEQYFHNALFFSQYFAK